MPDWLVFANRQAWPWLGLLGLILLAVTMYQYRFVAFGIGPHEPVRWRTIGPMALLLRLLGAMAMLLCLLEPMITRQRPRPQANVFGVVVDNSQSMIASNENAKQVRDSLDAILDEKSEWQQRLAQDFVVRRYAFDQSLTAQDTLAQLSFDGTSSALMGTLQSLSKRYADRPVAGILLFSDGNATDLQSTEVKDWKSIGFPVYPVTLQSQRDLRDISVGELVTSQSDFEAAPVTIRVPVHAQNLEGQKARVRIMDSKGQSVQSEDISLPRNGIPKTCEFRFRPASPAAGQSRILDYRAVVSLVSEADSVLQGKSPSEATVGNNVRYQAIDRGGGPYRILYVAGRPNWEHKFLKRSLDEDDEIHLVSLVRIAKKEPKFNFRDSRGESSNPLFAGFQDIDPEDKERFDEAVFVRQGVIDGKQLSKGFPDSMEELYDYHAVIVDDLESDALKQDQLSLLRQYVSVRGGALLFLGGQETMRGKAFQTSALGELAPIYPGRESATNTGAPKVAFQLSREGWLQPFMRLAESEELERKRLANMPPFEVLNSVGDTKPGASVHAQVQLEDESLAPALVSQRFGKGKTVAFLVGDLWRWAMHQDPQDKASLQQAWRQWIRWSISDVPKRLEFDISENSEDRMVSVRLKVRDEQFKPTDRAQVQVTLTPPGQPPKSLAAEASSERSGEYEVRFMPISDGVYLIAAQAMAEDGSTMGAAETGWANHLLADEFQRLGPNQELLADIARQSGGEVISASGLESFVANLQSKKVPITETWLQPLWHQPWVLMLALACLCGEWALRRWNGLP